MDFLNRQKKKNVIIYAYKRLFDTEDGKIVLKDLAKSCHFDTPTFDPDPYQSAFQEGERHLFLRIIRTINADPERLLEIVKTNQEVEE